MLEKKYNKHLHMRFLLTILFFTFLSVKAFAELSIVHYERAYELIYRQLYHQREVPFKDIVFAIENAYLGDSANYDEYNQEIGRMVSALRRQAETYSPFSPSKEMALLQAISTCYSQPNEANKGKPFTYDMLPTLRQNHPHYGLVITLLKTGRGTCRSLPFLFKILADELGVDAYITMAPYHYFIQHLDQLGNWWNFETTAGRYLTSAAIMELTETRPAGVRSGLYFHPMNKDELMIVCLNDLIRAYYLRTGRYTDPFVRRCYGVGLLFYPNSILLTHLYNDCRAVLSERAQSAGIKDTIEIKDSALREEYLYVESIREGIESIGYQEWTDDYLSQYLQRMQNYVELHPQEFQ